MVLGIIAFVGEHRPDPGHDREGSQKQALEDQCIVDIGGGATHATGTPSPSTATLYFVPRLARSVGLGPVRSPARLARTEQLSRIRSGWPRSMPTSTACTWASTPVSAQRVSHRRRVEPLA